MLVGSTCSAGGRRFIKQQLIIIMMMMMMMATTTCETSGSHSGVGEDSILLECNAVKNGIYQVLQRWWCLPTPGPAFLDNLSLSLRNLLSFGTAVTVH